jgi:biopolymer transport protein ExbB
MISSAGLETFGALDLLVRGGWVMFIILACSIASLSLIISKSRQLWPLCGDRFLRRKHATDFIEDAVTALHRDGPRAALAVLESTNHPVARVMETAVDLCKHQSLSIEDIEREVVRIGSLSIRELDKGLRGLSGLAQITPLLGLLGTVIGMIIAFITIQDAGAAVNPALLAGGIWQALLTTAFGLIVAVPTMGAYYFFEGLIDEVASQMRNGTERTLLYFKKETNTLTNFARSNDWRAHAN